MKDKLKDSAPTGGYFIMGALTGGLSAILITNVVSILAPFLNNSQRTLKDSQRQRLEYLADTNHDNYLSKAEQFNAVRAAGDTNFYVEGANDIPSLRTLNSQQASNAVHYFENQ